MRRKISIQYCDEAQRDHHCDARSFAHVFHIENTICITPEFGLLPQTFQAGILLHELGHLEYDHDYHTEKDADQMGETLADVEIDRRTYQGKKNLEYVSPCEVGKALNYIRKRTNRDGPRLL